jgi:hypothetical protein
MSSILVSTQTQSSVAGDRSKISQRDSSRELTWKITFPFEGLVNEENRMERLIQYINNLKR